jgi:hypothetical protein
VSGQSTGENTITWQQPLDLSQAVSPQFYFRSSLHALTSLAQVNISADGITWYRLSAVSLSDGWTEINIDLSAYRGQIILVQFQWFYVEPPAGQPGDSWMVDEVSIVDNHVVVSVETIEIVPTGTETPLPTATATFTATATETLMPVDINELTVTEEFTGAVPGPTIPPAIELPDTVPANVEIALETPAPVEVPAEVPGESASDP